MAEKENASHFTFSSSFFSYLLACLLAFCLLPSSSSFDKQKEMKRKKIFTKVFLLNIAEGNVEEEGVREREEMGKRKKEKGKSKYA